MFNNNEKFPHCFNGEQGFRLPKPRNFGRGINMPHHPPPIPPPPPGQPGHPPFPPHFGPPPPFGPPLPISRKSFHKIRNFVILIIIAEHSEGITGYQIQDQYNFPRGTLLRTLDSLEEKEYLVSKEEIIDGRTNKFFLITDKGRKHLEELKKKMSYVFGFMTEMAPPELYGKSFLKEGIRKFTLSKIKEFQEKEDALDFFGGIRSWIKSRLHYIEFKKAKLNGIKSNLDEVLNQIGKMKDFNENQLELLLKRLFEEEKNKEKDDR